MKRICTISFVLSYATLLPAQNLVPNGSFEEYTECPTYFGLAHFATSWMQLYTQSADYFNMCHTTGVVGMPLNYFGNQLPALGDAYMGLCTYQFNQAEYREIIGIQLVEPLQPSVPICLSFKTAVGGFGTSPGASAGYTCKGLGLKFFTELPQDWVSYLYPNSAALSLDIVPTDTAIWYNVSGTYVPDSAYSYLVIGNFYDEAYSEPTMQDVIGVGATDWAYAFIDDIRASFDLSYCAIDLGIPLEHASRPVVYPVPFVNDLRVRWPALQAGSIFYVVFDPVGRCVQQGGIEQMGEETVIHTEGLPSGVYHLRLSTTTHSWSPITVVHVSP